MSLSIELYIHLRLGLRGTSLLIAYLSERFSWGIEKTPCPNSIKNWVEKCSYKIYEEAAYKNSEFPYAQIIDESMLIGKEKLLLSLGVKADKEKESALSFEDITILDMSVRPSWNTDSVEKVIEKVTKQNGKPPQYVISDNAGILTKAAHSLLPPKQGSIARFMNLSSSIEWAESMLHNFASLNEEEQKVFNFIHKHTDIIDELKVLFKGINEISKELKNKGLSFKSIKICHHKIAQLQQSSTAIRIKHVLDACSGYLNQMKAKLPNKDTVWHISSDIIESTFSYYKFRKSTNPLNGVTTQIFILPLVTKINKKTGRVGFSVKTALEDVFLSNLKRWRDSHLTENMVVTRRKTLLSA